MTAAEHPRPKVFMLWGAHAQPLSAPIAAAENGHLVLPCNHPSPLSANRGPVPFVGCGHFGRAREFLRKAEPTATALDWRLDAPEAPG